MAKGKQAQVVITANASVAERVMQELEGAATRASNRMLQLAEAGNKIKKEMKQLAAANKQNTDEYKALSAAMKQNNKDYKVAEKEFQAFNSRMRENVKDTKRVEEVMKNLSGTATRDLRRALQAAKRELDKLSAEDPRRTKLVSDLKKIQTQIDANTGALKRQQGAWGALGMTMKNLFAYAGIFAGFNILKSKLIEAYEANKKFSDSMANVRKVSGLAMDDIKQLANNLSGIDSRTSLEGLMELSYTGAKLGFGNYGIEGLESFAKSAVKVQNALSEDMGADSMTALSKLVEVMGLIPKMGVERAMDAAGSAIFRLASTSTATGTNIIEFTKRLMGLANVSHVTTSELLALGSASDSMGLMAEVSATAFNKVFTSIQSNTRGIEDALKMTRGTLTDLVNQGRTMDAIVAVFEKMHGMSMDQLKNQGVFMALGSDGARLNNVMITMANRIDMLREHLMTSNMAFEEGTAVAQEYAIQMDTAAAYSERAANVWNKAFVNPEGVDTVKEFTKAWYEVSKSMTGNKAVMGEIKFLLAGIMELMKGIIYLLPSILMGLTAMGGFRLGAAIATGLKPAWDAVRGMTASVAALRVGWTALSTVARANIFGAAVTAIFALVEVIGMFNKKVKEASGYMEGFKRDLSDLNLEYGKAESELRRYRRAIDEANTGSKQRSAAIQQFNQKFKPYLSNLLTEKSTALDVAKAYQEVCKQMRTKLALQLKEKDIEQQVMPREQWTAQRREEYDRAARAAGMGQYGSTWITGYAQDNRGRNVNELVRELGKQYYNLPQKVIDEIVTQATAGAREFNNYGNIINSKYLKQANALLAAGSYLRQDRSAENAMRRVNQKWKPEQDAMDAYLAAQNQEEPITPIDESRMTKEEIAAAKKAEAERRKALRAEMKEEQTQAKAIIDNVKNYYQRQINAITEMANTTGMDPKLQDQMVNGMKERMNTALANVRKAIGGTKNDWEAFKQTMRQDLYEPLDENGENFSTELLDKVMDNNLEQLRKMIETLSKELNQNGSALLDQILRKATESEGINAKIENVLMRAREQELLERNYTGKVDKDTEGVMEQFGIAAITDAQSRQIRDWSAQGNDPALQHFLEMRTKYWQVAFGNARKNLLDLLQQDVSTKQGQESVLQLLFGEDWKEGLTGSELEGILNMTADQWKVFYMKLIEHTDKWTDAQKKAYDEVKKRQDYLFENRTDVIGLNSLEIGYQQQAKANDRWGKPQTFMERMGLGSLDNISNDPEVKMMEIRLTKAELYYKRMQELRKQDQISEEQLQTAKEQWASAQEALMDKVAQEAQQKMQQIQQLLDPIKDFGAAAGEAMYMTVNGLDGEGEAWRNAIKSIIKTYGEMTIQMIEKQLIQMLVMKQHHQEQESEEQAHQDRMRQIQSQGDSSQLSAQSLLNAKLISVKKKGAKQEQQEEKKSEDTKVDIAGEGGQQLLDIGATVASGMVNAKREEAQETQAVEQQQQATSLSGLISDTVAKVVLGIAGGSAKTISELGWWGLPLVAVISAALMGLLNYALSAIGGGGKQSQASTPKTNVKLASGMLTYDEGNVQEVLGSDGRVYRAREQHSLPEGVSMVTQPIATTVNGQPALVGERGPEIVIGRRTTRRLMMNEPGLLARLAQIEQGGGFYAPRLRGLRTLDDGNLADLVGSVAVSQQQSSSSPDGSQTLDADTAAALQQLPAAMAAFAQVMQTIQTQGIPGYFKKFGSGSLDEGMRDVSNFRKRYPNG